MKLCNGFGLAAWLVCGAAWASAQQPGSYPVDTPTQQSGLQGLLPGSPFQTLAERGEVPPAFDPGDTRARRFRGFPTLAPQSFGSYPGGRLPLPFETGSVGAAPVPMQPRSENAWPGWLDADGEGFTTSVAILVQNSDYVWVREEEDTAYTPLAPHDRYRVIRAGTEVDVRGGGHYQLALHGGAAMRVLGRSHLTVSTLDEATTELRFDSLSHLFAFTRERPVRVRLADSVVVEMSNARVSFERQLDGSIACSNETRGNVVVEVHGQRTELATGRRVLLLPASGEKLVPGELAFEGAVRLARDGRVLRAVGSERGGSVSWGGARFRVGGGGVLRIDPLSGKDFPSTTSNHP